MIETFHSALAFSIGVVSGFLPCCFVTYPGLFAYFSPDEGRVSRIRVALVCVSFSAGVAFVGAVITGGLLSLGLVILRDTLGLGSVGANYAGWGTLNLLSSVGAAVMAAGIAVFAWNLVASLRSGALAGDDPWDGFTLEWTTTSPPPADNFAQRPEVRSRRPLWDRKYPQPRGTL